MLEEPEEPAGCFQALLRLPLIGSEALLMFAGGSQQFDLSSQMLRAWFVYQIRNEDLVHWFIRCLLFKRDTMFIQGSESFSIDSLATFKHLLQPSWQRWGSREAGEASVATSPAILGLKDIPLWLSGLQDKIEKKWANPVHAKEHLMHLHLDTLIGRMLLSHLPWLAKCTEVFQKC